MLHAARCKCRTQKIRQKSPSRHHRTTLSGYIFATEACIDNRKKNLLSSNISSTCTHNMVNFGPLAAEIVSLVWGTPANFNGFRVLAALLYGTPVVASAKLCGVEQRAPPVFGKATITLGICPHSSFMAVTPPVHTPTHPSARSCTRSCTLLCTGCNHGRALRAVYTAVYITCRLHGPVHGTAVYTTVYPK